MKDEVALRAARPSSLPVEGGDGPGGMELVSPLRGAGKRAAWEAALEKCSRR